MADRHNDLVRVLPDAVAVRLTYWLVTRAETLRRPEVAAVVDAIQQRMIEQADVLLGADQLRVDGD
jgi:DNA-binding transcriptional LysR family regulator